MTISQFRCEVYFGQNSSVNCTEFSHEILQEPWEVVPNSRFATDRFSLHVYVILLVPKEVGEFRQANTKCVCEPFDHVTSLVWKLGRKLDLFFL